VKSLVRVGFLVAPEPVEVDDDLDEGIEHGVVHLASGALFYEKSG